MTKFKQPAIVQEKSNKQQRIEKMHKTCNMLLADNEEGGQLILQVSYLDDSTSQHKLLYKATKNISFVEVCLDMPVFSCMLSLASKKLDEFEEAIKVLNYSSKEV